MSLADDLQRYRAQWAAVAAIEAQERLTATFEQRWRQLNALYAMGLALNLIHPDPTETEVHLRWAKLQQTLLAIPPASSSPF